jgi:hypothetical protein
MKKAGHRAEVTYDISQLGIGLVELLFEVLCLRVGSAGLSSRAVVRWCGGVVVRRTVV